MTLQQRWDLFLRRATEMHGDKFDYSQAVFVKQKEKIKIICPDHGEFYQTPDKHLAKNSKGCPECWNDIQPFVLKGRAHSKPKLPLPEGVFLARANEKFKNKYSYNMENYSGYTKNKITIICPIHGQHSNIPQAHLSSGTGCPKCGINKGHQTRRHSYNKFLEQAQLLFNYEYDYPDTNGLIYKTKKSIVDIICHKHGPFKKKAQKHLVGQGCFLCKVEQMVKEGILAGGYSEELFEEKPELKENPASLYYLKINNGELFKIGISKSLTQRISGLRSKAQEKIRQIEVLFEFRMTLYKAFRIEQKLLKKNKSIRVYTDWSTELFSTDISDQIKEIIDKMPIEP